jgi:hypothetical protein
MAPKFLGSTPFPFDGPSPFEDASLSEELSASIHSFTLLYRFRIRFLSSVVSCHSASATTLSCTAVRVFLFSELCTGDVFTWLRPDFLFLPLDTTVHGLSSLSSRSEDSADDNFDNSSSEARVSIWARMPLETLSSRMSR